MPLASGRPSGHPRLGDSTSHPALRPACGVAQEEKTRPRRLSTALVSSVAGGSSSLSGVAAVALRVASCVGPIEASEWPGLEGCICVVLLESR